MTVRQYFGTDGIRGKVGDAPITPEFVLKLGWAVGNVLANGGKSRVLIGKDTRISGYMLESALQAGLSSAGVNVSLMGPMPTPAVAYLTRTLGAMAGIVISASHNPHFDNGIKFFSGQGAKLPEEVELAIEDEIGKPLQTVASAHLGKASRIPDAAGRYIEFCKSTIPSTIEFRDLKIVVDCAHGATYHIAPHVFSERGADVIAIGTAPDGLNINEDVGTTYPQALQAAVLENNADIGVALDGDGDRVIMVDGKGEVVDGDELLFIIARSRLENHALKGGVVGTVMSNLGLEHALMDLGIAFKRSAVGDRYVMEMLKKRHWILGGESSGHIMCLDRTTTGDGIISALQVMAAMHIEDSPLHELKTGMVKYPQRLINVPVTNKEQTINSSKLQQVIKDIETQQGDRGRVSVRPSGTESLIRVMVEGRDAREVSNLAESLAGIVEEIAASDLE